MRSFLASAVSESRGKVVAKTCSAADRRALTLQEAFAEKALQLCGTDLEAVWLGNGERNLVALVANSPKSSTYVQLDMCVHAQSKQSTYMVCIGNFKTKHATPLSMACRSAGAAGEHADMRAKPLGGVPATAVRGRAALRLRPRRAELGPRLVRLLHAPHDPGRSANITMVSR